MKTPAFLRCLAAGALLAASSSAWAGLLTFSATPDPFSAQVAEQSPCIIGDASPNDATKGGCSPKKNNITGGDLPATALYQPAGGNFSTFRNAVTCPENVSLVAPYSTCNDSQYTVADFAAFPVFDVGLDMNSLAQTPDQTDTLFWFRIYVGGTLAYWYEDDTVISSINNGTGYSDYKLGTVDLRNLAAGTSVVFDAKWQSGDGNDYFFVIPTSAQNVPEPASLGLLALGLAGLAMVRRRR